MHVCMYACMHVCMYACMHVCMYACMHVCMYACMHVCMYACMHVCMYACMHKIKQVTTVHVHTFFRPVCSGFRVTMTRELVHQFTQATTNSLVQTHVYTQSQSLYDDFNSYYRMLADAAASPTDGATFCIFRAICTSRPCDFVFVLCLRAIWTWEVTL